MCMWEWATFGSHPWLTWCISCSVLHAVMMMPRPSLVLGLLTTFLLFFLPILDNPGLPNTSSPSTTSSPDKSNHLERLSSTHFLALLLTIVIGCCDLSWKHLWILLHQWCTPKLLIGLFFSFFSLFLLISLLLWNKHAGYVLYARLFWSGGLSDCKTCPFCAFMLWDHCGSGRPLFLFACVHLNNF